jgi:hypothetical protein
MASQTPIEQRLPLRWLRVLIIYISNVKLNFNQLKEIIDEFHKKQGPNGVFSVRARYF